MFLHLTLQPPRVEPEAARADFQRAAIGANRADDHGRRPNQLSDSDHGAMAEGSHRRHLQPRERTQALVAADRLHAQPAEIVRQQHRRALAQPPRAHIIAGLEWHDEHARARGTLRDSLLARGKHCNNDQHETEGASKR